LEIESSKAAKKNSEDELQRRTEANAVQRRKLRQLKDEIKAMKAKKDLIIEEISELTSLVPSMVLHPEQANTGHIISRIWPESKQCPLALKNGTTNGGAVMDICDGIIAHLMRGCGGNMPKRDAVDVTSSSLSQFTRIVADLDADSSSALSYRNSSEDIPLARRNWVCYDFKDSRIVPIHCAICTNSNGPAFLIQSRGSSRRRRPGRTGGRWTKGRTTSSSTPYYLMEHFQSRATGSRASSGQCRSAGITLALTSFGLLRVRSSGTSSSKRLIPPGHRFVHARRSEG
jgi:hypothetical protein